MPKIRLFFILLIFLIIWHVADIYAIDDISVNDTLNYIIDDQVYDMLWYSVDELDGGILNTSIKNDEIKSMFVYIWYDTIRSKKKVSKIYAMQIKWAIIDSSISSLKLKAIWYDWQKRELFLTINEAYSDTDIYNINHDISNKDNSDRAQIIMINDIRCVEILCDSLWAITQNLKSFIDSSEIDIVSLDFSSNQAKQVMIDNDIEKLPAILLNTDKLKNEVLISSLSKTKQNLYNLDIGANFDPYISRSDRWFAMLSSNELDSVLEYAHILWSDGYNILWINYSDLWCGHCINLHNWTQPWNAWNSAYGVKTLDMLNTVFPKQIAFIHQYLNSWYDRKYPEILECIYDIDGIDGMYSAIDILYNTKNLDTIDLDEDLWVDDAKIDECLSSEVHRDILNKTQELWKRYFNINWAPWNILINIDTLEYISLIWAFPTSDFIETIYLLLDDK